MTKLHKNALAASEIDTVVITVLTISLRQCASQSCRQEQVAAEWCKLRRVA